MEMGCDGVLINSAIALAKNPINMAEAFKHAVISGRKSFLSGRMKKNSFAVASSPKEGVISASFFFTHPKCSRFFIFL